ncbi:radical SAM protein [Solidesulfovibrio sp.]|uniref:radical SAM protein n=1 Tax=Solidesulfovibrio sp. TaxID=2910990 RepID=UPI002B21A450|nr:radical SAM protein [Solidesulfovibrio sp.]MEA5089630.1 radical SAM protein [Solidesulfovibrio sp.]
MKVLCANPPWWIEDPDAIYGSGLLAGVRAGSRWPFTSTVRSRPGQYRFGDYIPYPFFLGSAASYLAREPGVAVSFRDSIALREDYDKFFKYLAEGKFDYVVIESASPSWGHDAELIAHIAADYPHTRVVVAGPIASLGEKLLADHPLHAVIQGEYEKGLVKVVGGASGLVGYDILTEAELNAAPYPYFDPLHANKYWDSNPKGQVFPQLQVLTSRGCPFRCIFCVWPAVMSNNDPDGTGVRRVRQLSGDYLEGMLTELIGRYGYKSVYFDDDTFNLGDRHVLEVCAVMARLGLPWSAMCRADTIAWDTWRVMRESGCFGVKIGFESGNQWVVDNIVRKNLDLEKARDVVYHLKALGMTVHGTFTVGLPGETPEQMADTRRYRSSLPLDSFQESGTAEIEGSPLSTLRRTGSLEKYAGASLEGYVAERDGTRKMRLVELRDAGLGEAEMCLRHGRPAVAESICRNLLDTGGEDGKVLDLLGSLAVRARKFDLAVRFFSRAIAADAAYAAPCLHLGLLLRDQGLAEEAASCLRRALALDPESLDARQALVALGADPDDGDTPDAATQASLARSLAAVPVSSWGRTLRRAMDAADAPQEADAAEGTDGEGKYPRLIVLDHGLRFLAGHHFAYNLGVLAECVKRELPVEFYVYADCQPEAVKVLRAKAVLQPSRYESHSSDRYCSWLEDFLIAGGIAEFNLFKNLRDLDPSDIVFCHTADPKIVRGIAAWYLAMDKARRPYLCLKFQNHCFRFVAKDQRALARSIFRLALKPFINEPKVSFAASNKLIGSQITQMAEKPCPVFPVPLQLEVPAKKYRSRAEKGVLRIGYAGEGRVEQGVGFLPEVAEAILPAYPDVVFELQFACRFVDDDTLNRLRSFGDRVRVHESCFVGDDFHRLIASFDALLLPYQPTSYVERSSQIVIEAIALGVPLIVPVGTSLALEVKQFNCGYSLIRGYDGLSVIEAVAHFIDNHDALARKSADAAPRCAAFHSGGTLIDLLLASCGVPVPRTPRREGEGGNGAG